MDGGASREWRTAIWEEGLNKQKKLKKRDEEKAHYANICCFITISKLCKGNQKVLGGGSHFWTSPVPFFLRTLTRDLCLCALRGHLTGRLRFPKWTFSLRNVAGKTSRGRTDVSRWQRREEAQLKGGDGINLRRQRTRCVPKDCRSPRPDTCLSARHPCPPPVSLACGSLCVWPKSWHC